MKRAIKIAVLIMPALFMSVIFYLAVVDNWNGPVLHDRVVASAGADGQQPGPGSADKAKDEQVATLRPLYKWRDKNNTIVISTESPPNGMVSETFYFSTGGGPVTDTGPVAQPETGAGQPPDSTLVDNPVSVYTPSGLRQLIHYSREIGNKIELRGKELNNLVYQLQDR